MRPLLILNDTRPNSDWPEQKLIEMEINKPMRTHWLKQLKSPVDVARNTGDLSPQMIVSGVSVFLSSLSSAPHLLSASQTGSLIISYNSGTVARISGGLHPSRFKNSRKKKRWAECVCPNISSESCDHFDSNGFSYVYPCNLLLCPEKWNGLG